MANFYSAAEHRSRGALWPSFAPARIPRSGALNVAATDIVEASDDAVAFDEGIEGFQRLIYIGGRLYGGVDVSAIVCSRKIIRIKEP